MSTTRNIDAKIEAEYPPPIAVLWSQVMRVEEVAARTQRLHAIVECTLSLVNAMLLADYVGGEPDGMIDGVLTHQRPTVGVRLGLQKNLVSHAIAQPEPAFFAGALEWKAWADRWSMHERRANALLMKRNNDAHPRAMAAPEAEDPERCAALLNAVRELLDGLSWLASFQFFRVIRVEQTTRGTMQGTVELLVGTKRPCARVDLEWPAQVPLRQDRVWLRHGSGTRVLDVTPFVRLLGSGADPALAYFDRSDPPCLWYVNPLDADGARATLRDRLPGPTGLVDLDAWLNLRSTQRWVWTLSEEPAHDGLRKGRRIGRRFELKQFIGVGGMSEVWAACDLEDGADVAIKVLSKSAANDEDLRIRFSREVDVLKRVKHARVIRCHQSESFEGRPAMVMDLHAGTLKEKIGRPNDQGQVSRWVMQVLEGLAALHAVGVVHRDIKPANLFLTAHDEVVVGDLGVMLDAEDSRLTQTSERIGTYRYMAPELDALGEASAASDLYALAVVAHELCMGKAPRKTEVPGSGIAGVLGELVRAMGSENPGARPSAAEALSRLRPPAAATLAAKPGSTPNKAAGVLAGGLGLFGLSGAAIIGLVGVVWLVRPWVDSSPELVADAAPPSVATEPPAGAGAISGVIAAIDAGGVEAVPAAGAPSGGAAFASMENRVGMGFVALPAGDFARDGRNVTLTRGFWVGLTEVTQGQWRKVMRDAPWASRFEWVQNLKEGLKRSGACIEAGVGDAFPAVCMSWLEAARFCNALSAHEGLRPAYALDGDRVTWRRHENGYRLLTAAEWEYAARAGAAGAWGAPEADPTHCKTANVLDRSGLKVTRGDVGGGLPCDDGHAALAPVGAYAPNAWGLHDTVGNVWEWVWDHKDGQALSTFVDPVGPPEGKLRARRGGGWASSAKQAQVTNHVGWPPNTFNRSTGLRVARNLD